METEPNRDVTLKGRAGSSGCKDDDLNDGRVECDKVCNARGRGKTKVYWKHGDNKILWDCFLRSGGVRTDRYIGNLKYLRDTARKGPRSTTSLSVSKQIINNVNNEKGRN